MTALHEPSGEAQPLVIAAAGTVDHHQGRPVAAYGIFEKPRSRSNGATDPGRALSACFHEAQIRKTRVGYTEQHHPSDAQGDRCPPRHSRFALGKCVPARLHR